MVDAVLHAAGPMIGGILVTVFLLVQALPLIAGLLMAFRIVRYREWLAILAVLASTALLAVSGDYLYNLTYWTTSRFPLWMNAAECALTFGTPLFLFVLVLVCSRRRWLWGAGMLLLTSLSVISARNEFVTRKERDAEAYRRAVKPISPRTGFVWWGLDDYHSRPGKVLLSGHAAEGASVVLLSDPFTRDFEAQFCTGTAAAYHPPVRDPAEMGNVTEVANLKGCGKRMVRGVAVLERAVMKYRAVPFQPYAGAADPKILANPVVRQAFAKLGYDAANFDAAKAALTQASAAPGAALIITAIKPLRTPPNAFPCFDPALLAGLQEPANVKAVLPYCAVSWNLFELDGEFYFAATTQQPTPPGELVMNPDRTNWLFRVEGTDLKQIWPAS